MKKNLYTIYGLNLTRTSSLLNFFGFSNIKSKNLKDLKFYKKKMNFFLLKKLENKDFVLKKKYDSVSKKIDNGSYKGYKFTRGLPIYNQRTRTNAKNAKKQNSNFLNVYL
jgi:ribosomal protein S13